VDPVISTVEQAVKKAQDYLISMGYNGTVTDDELAAYVQRRRIETAYHEAGHTVAAVMCGGTVPTGLPRRRLTACPNREPPPRARRRGFPILASEVQP
jgi:hypothetical protein